MQGPDTILRAQSRSGPIVLRHPRWADFEVWAELRDVSRRELKRWEPDWNERHFERRSFKTRLAAYRRLAQAGTAYPFHVFRADGTLVGAVNLSDIRRHIARSAEIGYWTGTPHARQGYAKAAVARVLRFAFDDLGLHRVSAAVQEGNLPSVGLLEGVGFQREGLARGYLKVGGQWRDHRIFAKLSSD